MNKQALQTVEWRDLRERTRWQIARQLCAPLLWLALALAAASVHWHALAALATLALFVAGLRITHDAFHRVLGISRRANDLVMLGIGILLGGAMHAIEYTHLYHHRHCMGDKDVEGHIGRMGFWRALQSSPLYPVMIHVEAWRRGTGRQRRWITLELACTAALQIGIWCVWDNDALQVVAVAMLFNNMSVAMIGIWLVHHGCENEHFMARTSRWPILNTLVGGLFFHLEHHLYPGVPSSRLPELVKRFDTARGDSVRVVYGTG